MDLRSYISNLLLLSKSATFLMVALFSVQLYSLSPQKKSVRQSAFLSYVKLVQCCTCDIIVSGSCKSCDFMPIECVKVCGGPGYETPTASPAKNEKDGGPGYETPTASPAKNEKDGGPGYETPTTPPIDMIRYRD